jgi:hypothetical protein
VADYITQKTQKRLCEEDGERTVHTKTTLICQPTHYAVSSSRIAGEPHIDREMYKVSKSPAPRVASLKRVGSRVRFSFRNVTVTSTVLSIPGCAKGVDLINLSWFSPRPLLAPIVSLRMADYTSPTAEAAEARALSPSGISQTGGIPSSSSASHQRPHSSTENGYQVEDAYPVAESHIPTANVPGSHSAVAGLSIKSGINGSSSHGAGLGGAAEMVRKKMGSFVGFANLPNQVHRKSVK